MAIRNSIFKFINQVTNLGSQRSLGYLPSRNTDVAALKKVIQHSDEIAQHQRQVKNLVSAVRKGLPEEERAEFDILQKYHENGQLDTRVEPQNVLLQLDRIQVLKNLKMIELNEVDVDPELVRYEKLKARVLLEEEGAAKEYQEYIANRPFMKAFERINVGDEKYKQQFMY